MLKKLVVRQHDIKDCGAACLLSIIKYYNGNISLEKIRVDTCINKNGITAYNLVTAAQNYGFESHGLRITFDDLTKEKLVLPAIAYLELENGLKHYVVIYKIAKKNILIMDPAKGMVKVKYEIFKKNFKDVLIIFSPISKIVNYSHENKLYDNFIRFLKEDKKLIINLLLTSMLLTIVSIIGSFYIKVTISLVDQNLKGTFYLVLIITLIVYLMKILFAYLRNYYETYLNKNIDVKLIPNFVKHIFNLPLNAISNRTTGEIITRVNELNNIKELFAHMFVTLVLNILLAITSCFVLMLINVRLTNILIIIVLIYLLNNLIWLKPINKLVEDNIYFETNFNSNITNNLSHIITIKNSNNYPIFRLEQTLISYLENTFKFQGIINIYKFINSFIVEIGLFILNSVGLLLVINQELSLVDLITYDSLYLYFIDPIKDIISLIPKYVYIKRSFAKINDFLMLEEELKNKEMQEFVNGNITFENISFSYNMYDYPINNYNLEIKENSKVLVMGKSGCGKSTLFKLLFRLYDPIKGNIKINDINIKDYNLFTIRSNIAYVSQDEGIFNDTLMNNITLGRDIDMQYLNKILYLCEINDILDKKTLRLDTYIREDASNLSGGERARIILARALIKNSNIIIFDETFSAVSENDANKMIDNIFNEYKNKTIILISHFKPKYKFDLEIIGDFNG